MKKTFSFQRLWSVAKKEMHHIFRDPMLLGVAMIVPLFELFLLGYAIDTNVRDVSTVIIDQDKTQESRALLRRFENSQDFKILKEVYTDEELSREIVRGKARVGIKIPANYSERLEKGETAQILVLVDGSESSVTAEAVNVSNAIALRESLGRALGEKKLPVEARPRVLFNPDSRSANFFIPGLLVVLCQFMATALAANAIVREKERGTLEQLFMTPVRPSELILGKMAPYIVLTFVEFGLIIVLMQTIFGVPINGALITLVFLTLPFILSNLGIGLWISTRASTREAAMQMSMGTLLPSIFLSGYVFPIASMPLFFQWVSNLLPTTWLIDASRGVILRGAGLEDLWLHGVIMWGMTIAVVVMAAFRFRKRVA